LLDLLQEVFPVASAKAAKGTIADIRDRLLLWASRPVGCLLKVEFASEFSRQQVMADLRSTLADRDIPFYELSLPAQQEPVVALEAILAEIERLPAGVLSISGFSNAFASQFDLLEAMGVLNYNRDRLVANSLRQIWWMTPSFSQLSLYGMPDIHSWFIAKLKLTEYQPLTAGAEEPMKMAGVGTYANIDDARRRSQGLLQRLQVAQDAGIPDIELLETFLLPALEILAEVGAAQSLRDLTLQFEGILSQLSLPGSPRLATALGRIARLYKDQGRFGEAEPLYQRSLEIKEKSLGAEHPSVAVTLNNLAELYRSQGLYEKAEPMYQRSLEIKEKSLGAEHPSVAVTLNNLAGLYESQGLYEKAEPLYQRSLEISEKSLGAEHPSVATTLNNLAGLYRSQGLYEKAEPLYQRSLEISEKSLGAEHPNVAVTLGNLAGLYRSQELYEKAEPLYLRDLAISEKSLGAEHPDVAVTLNNLAGLYESQGLYEKAEPLYQRSLEIKEKSLGAEHPSVAVTLNNLASLYHSQGLYEKAEPLYQRSLEIQEKTLGA
jgi:tetratricopeptide (TPR) repeat protein